MVISQRRWEPRAGFSLLELLAVVAIMVVLISVGGVAYFSYIDKAKDNTALMGVRNIETAVMAFKTNHDEFPPSLDMLIQPLDGQPALLEQKDLFDPWKNPYVYEPNNLNANGKPRIYSQGPRPGDPTSIKANW